MHPPVQLSSEYRICFQAFHTSTALSEFLLSNRLQQVIAHFPTIKSLQVVIQGPHTVKPHHVTSLACLLEEYYRAGISISFEDGSSVVYPYLKIIGFFELWKPESERSLEFAVPADSTSFVMWRATPESMDAYVAAAYQHYRSSFFTGKDLSFLTTYLGELFNNVFDHAFTAHASERVAFGFLQYYPSRRRLFIAVSDFGMGIPTSVNLYLRS